MSVLILSRIEGAEYNGVDDNNGIFILSVIGGETICDILSVAIRRIAKDNKDHFNITSIGDGEDMTLTIRIDYGAINQK